MDRTSVQAKVALITGAVSLITSIITASVTLRVAEERAGTDAALTALKHDFDGDLQNRRALIDERLKLLEGKQQEKLEELRLEHNKELEILKNQIGKPSWLAAEIKLRAFFTEHSQRIRTEDRIKKLFRDAFTDQEISQILVGMGATATTLHGQKAWHLPDSPTESE